MKEIYPGIFQKVINFEDKHALPRNIYIIKQSERNLLIDTTYRFDYAWRQLNQMIQELNIDYKKLDVFITHNHPDHIGYVYDLQQLGARVFMSPKEAELKTDILQCYLSNNNEHYVNLHSMGVTKERYPEEYDTLVMNLSRKLVERKEPYTFSYIPVNNGDRLTYGEYTFEVINLAGHTAGQCGLYDENHKIVFSGDQVVKNMVPIVMSQKRDIQLLNTYFNSLNEMAKKYQGCIILPCHNEIIADIKDEAQRIISSYQNQCEVTLQVLRSEREWMVTRDIGVRAYGGKYMAADYRKITLCTHIWAKTFSCLEYLYDKGMILRKEEDNVIYWKTKE